MEDEGRPREPVASNSMTTAKPKRTQAPENLFEYICPCCSELVTSTVRTGKVRHGGKCGGRFRVRDGRTVAKGYVYVCPFCTGKVLSNMKTGQINHRSVCNNQFYVKDGEVSKATRMYAHACPVCHTVVGHRVRVGAFFSSTKPQLENRARRQHGVCRKTRRKNVEDGEISKETRHVGGPLMPARETATGTLEDREMASLRRGPAAVLLPGAAGAFGPGLRA